MTREILSSKQHAHAGPDRVHGKEESTDGNAGEGFLSRRAAGKLSGATQKKRARLRAQAADESAIGCNSCGNVDNSIKAEPTPRGTVCNSSSSR